jgi:hypothetical protein
MQPEVASKQERVRQHVQASLLRAQTYTTGLRKTYTLLVVGSLVTSAATTLVAGGTAVQGTSIGSAWQIACAVAAVLSFISTICVGVMQQLKLGERLPLGQLCVGRLRGLEVALTMGTREWHEIAIEYEAILKEFSEVFS